MGEREVMEGGGVRGGRREGEWEMEWEGGKNRESDGGMEGKREREKGELNVIEIQRKLKKILYSVNKFAE